MIHAFTWNSVLITPIKQARVSWLLLLSLWSEEDNFSYTLAHIIQDPPNLFEKIKYNNALR
jgi:hypothetical protein